MPEELSRNERIKEASRYLRGTLAEGLAEEITGAIVEDDQQLVKFHGMYLQDDRDLRAERRRKKMEAAFAFMIRVRIPGGVLTPSQYLALDEIGRLYASSTITAPGSPRPETRLSPDCRCERTPGRPHVRARAREPGVRPRLDS